MNGVVIIDKPGGLTSHDVVNRLRKILGQRSVGHLGTLDPMATGVLPLVTGSLTRLAQFYKDSEKTYEGVIRLGFATDTYDAEGEPVTAAQNVKVSLEEMEALRPRFTGRIRQYPPPFSAKKIGGVPAYKLARKQKPVTLEPVEVDIKELAILGLEQELVSFRARVTSGTYLRAVAHDIGRELGCGAHLHSLRRTQFAEFGIPDALSLERVRELWESGETEQIFVHPRKLLPHFPAVSADERALALIRSGRGVNLADMSRSAKVKVFCGQRELVAIATRVAGTLFHAGIVLAGGEAERSAAVAGKRKGSEG
jgi:tRNA pseudouridine55 synthase